MRKKKLSPQQEQLLKDLEVEKLVSISTMGAYATIAAAMEWLKDHHAYTDDQLGEFIMYATKEVTRILEYSSGDIKKMMGNMEDEDADVGSVDEQPIAEQ